MPERILVTGATGKLGSEIVRLLLERGETVRAATRFPSDAAAMFGDDVEVVEMDYQSTETWDNAVQWVDRLFLMPPPFDPHAFDTLAPFLDWAVGSGTGKVVLLSAMAIDREPDLALIRLERHLGELDIAATTLRPNLYMQNLSTGFIADSIRDHGAIELSAGNGRVSFVDAADVAAVAATALTGDALDGDTVTLTGSEAFGFADVASRIADAAARPVDYRPADTARMLEILRAAHFSDAAAGVALELFDSIERAEREPVDSALADITGRPVARLDDFIAANAKAWS
jgi:uncharacterized protein YbjT (DUF2867 family)